MRVEFTTVPGYKLARVIRFVKSGVLPPKTLAMLDTRRNVLLVSSHHWQALTDLQRQALLMTSATLVEVEV